MMRANELLKIIRENDESIVNQVAEYFDTFFDELVKPILVCKSGYATIDVGQFLTYMRDKVTFNFLYDAEVVNRFVSDLQEAGYIAESVCPPMNPDYISIRVPK